MIHQEPYHSLKFISNTGGKPTGKQNVKFIIQIKEQKTTNIVPMKKTPKQIVLSKHPNAKCKQSKKPYNTWKVWADNKVIGRGGLSPQSAWDDACALLTK